MAGEKPSEFSVFFPFSLLFPLFVFQFLASMMQARVCLVQCLVAGECTSTIKVALLCGFERSSEYNFEPLLSHQLALYVFSSTL